MPSITVRLPDDLHDELAREALTRGLRLSDVVRERLDPRAVSSRDIAGLVDEHEERITRLEQLAGA